MHSTKQIQVFFKLGLSILSLTCWLVAYSQQSVSIIPSVKGERIELGSSFFHPESEDSIQIQTLRFYISDIKLLENSKEVFSFPQKHILMDLGDSKSLQLPLDIKENIVYNEIEFSIGVDSATNMAGALGGDLDPTKGMYWTWQSGYINFKLEGTSSTCPARNNLFQFHIGGYQYPNNTFQTISLPVKQKEDLVINLALDKLLSQIDLSEEYEVMSPNEKAMGFSELLTTIFEPSEGK